MSAQIIPFPPPPAPEPPLAERLAARRAYRQQCRELASCVIPAAFSDSWLHDARFKDLGIGEALPLCVAAMRRELRKSGLW